MRITLWGTRGSLASAGPDTVRYGGNTSCVEVRGSDGTLIVLDAGTGIRRLGAVLGADVTRITILLTHLHFDHIEGLGFFEPLFRAGTDVHVWGPPSLMHDLRTRLTRYLSPPLFPVRLRDLPSRVVLYDAPLSRFSVGALSIDCALITHPGPTVGYRVTHNGHSIAYLPDHEPALGAQHFPLSPEWTSGYALASGADLLIHDTQYTGLEYGDHTGWGHSAIEHTIAFARLARPRRLVTFHHDPSHSDAMLDQMLEVVGNAGPLPFDLVPGMEGMQFEL